MSIDQRLSRLAPVLTAQERAILILDAWKDGKPEDPAWRHTMPPEQSHAFNRYIDLINQANPVLGHLITALYHQARELELREAWLIDLTLWQEHVEAIQEAVRLAIDEPITQSEYDAKLASAREEWVPVRDLAAFLAGEREDWSEDDYREPEDDDYGPVISDVAWERAVAEEEKRLRALASAGTLPSRGKGKAMKLQASAVEHFGHVVDVTPENYGSYRVLPDDQAKAVDAELVDLRRLQDILGQQPYDWASDVEPALPEKIRSILQETIANQLISTWVELRCVEAILGEIAEAFNGADPLRPALREKLEATRQKLLTVTEHLRYLRIEVVLREPLEEELQEMRDWLASLPTP